MVFIHTTISFIHSQFSELISGYRIKTEIGYISGKKHSKWATHRAGCHRQFVDFWRYWKSESDNYWSL